MEARLRGSRADGAPVQSSRGRARQSRGFVPVSGEVRMSIVIVPGGMSSLVGTTLFHAVIMRNPTNFVSNVVRLQILP